MTLLIIFGYKYIGIKVSIVMVGSLSMPTNAWNYSG